MPVLDLTGADTSGFSPIPSGQYHAKIFQVKMEETKGREGAAMPKGTPMINVQFKIIGKDDEVGEQYEYFNRRVFSTFITTIPPAYGKKEPQKAARIKGILVNFLKSIGYTDEELNSNEFDLNVEDMISRDCRVTVEKVIKYGVNAEADDFDPEDQDNYTNNVKSVKAPSSTVAAGGSGLT